MTEKFNTEDCIRVQLIHRATGRFHSIEGLFNSLSKSFPNWVVLFVAKAPHGRANPISIFKNLWWIRTLQKCDLLHQTGDIHYSILAIWKLPAVLTIHDLRFFEEAHGMRRLLFWLFWLYLPCLRATRVTVISKFTKERLISACSVNINKIRIIPNCVSDQFVAVPRSWPEGTPRLLLVGTTDNKNLQRVVAACVGLNLRLCILGQLAPEQVDCLHSNKIDFENHVSQSLENVVALYESCDLLCFVSTYEGFGMPVLEAQAVGRPVITSDLSPLREVAGEGALKVNPLDVVAIREGIVQLLSDSELRDALVEEGFRNVSRYTPQSIASQYAALYRELVPV